MNTYLRKIAKNDFEKYFFKLMNNVVFGKTMENVRKHLEILNLVTTKRRKNYLVSEPNYHTAKFFTEHLLATSKFDWMSNDIITEKIFFFFFLFF